MNETGQNGILVIDNVLPEKMCNQIIGWFDENRDAASEGTAGRNLLDNKEIAINLKTYDDFYGLGHYLEHAFEIYKYHYPDLDHLNKFQVDNSLQLCKFEPGKYYEKPHCEQDGHPSYLKRVMTFMIYLNTIEEGGETKFNVFNVQTKAKKGTMVIWPAGWPYIHQGIVAPKSEKYFINGWVSYE